MNPHTYTGIDADTHRIALVTLRGAKVLRCVTVRRADRYGRIDGGYSRKLVDELHEAARLGAVVYFELPYFKPDDAQGNARCSARSYGAMREVKGEVQIAAWLSRVMVIGVEASQWQGEVLGKGMRREELKALSLKMAREPLAFLGRDITDHEADAWGVAEYARRNHRSRVASVRQENLALLD